MSTVKQFLKVIGGLFLVILVLGFCGNMMDGAQDGAKDAVSQAEESKSEKEVGAIGQGDVTDKQAEIVRVFAQNAVEEAGGDSHGFFDLVNWDVAKQERGGATLWIATTQSDDYGRVKYIVDWDGDEDNFTRYSDVYLLAGGDEIYNHLDQY